VFVTEGFAAILALESGGDFACRYMGRLTRASQPSDTTQNDSKSGSVASAAGRAPVA
jgi:hypothetical protein